MSDEFDRDLRVARESLASAREELLAVVVALAEDDLGRARRGGWSVRKVLEHVIHSEWLYSRLATHLRGQTAEGDLPATTLSSVSDVGEQLGASRATLLAAIDGIDEESFYRLQTVGHEEYSVLSLLENVALHDREHGPQVGEILAAG